MTTSSNRGRQARDFSCPNSFADEQARAGRNWTFVGMSWDLPQDQAWFRAKAGGREIFVQRFGDELRAFENVCAHRYMRLRRAERGVGPIVCPFHHWRYDAEGRATEIPNCREVYGKGPEEMGARLNRLELATAGAFVFVRLAGGGEGRPSLESWLGPMHAILVDRFPQDMRPWRARRPVAANWKLCCQIALDDYHIVAVHPGSFGRSGYLKNDFIAYHRSGPHSAYFTLPHTTDLEGAAAACAEGRYEPRGYRTFYIHPGLVVAEFRSLQLFGRRLFHNYVTQYAPEAVDRSSLRLWITPSPHNESGWARRPLRLLARLMCPLVRWRALAILAEDHAVCADLQAVAPQRGDAPLYGSQERRVAWFDKASRNEEPARDESDLS